MTEKELSALEETKVEEKDLQQVSGGAAPCESSEEMPQAAPEKLEDRELEQVSGAFRVPNYPREPDYEVFYRFTLRLDDDMDPDSLHHLVIEAARAHRVKICGREPLATEIQRLYRIHNGAIYSVGGFADRFSVGVEPYVHRHVYQ